MLKFGAGSLLSESWLFFQKFMRDPRKMGSILPSSSSLTRSMLKRIRWEQAHVVVELGAGTGVFTRAINELRRPDCEFLVFEQEEELRERLAERLRGSGIWFAADALELGRELRQTGWGRADAVVSGLPFANFAPGLRRSLIDQIKGALREEGVFVTFQYSLQMKKLLTEQFDEVSIAYVPFNVPPAFVYICRMRTEQQIQR